MIESGPLRRAAAATDRIDRGSQAHSWMLHFGSVAARGAGGGVSFLGSKPLWQSHVVIEDAIDLCTESLG